MVEALIDVATKLVKETSRPVSLPLPPVPRRRPTALRCSTRGAPNASASEAKIELIRKRVD